MKYLLKAEELAILILTIVCFSFVFRLDIGFYILLLFVPDISILAYFINNKVGGIIYNIFHTRILGISMFIVGLIFSMNFLIGLGLVFLGHTALDRLLGFGLKYLDSFHNTSLGRLSKK